MAALTVDDGDSRIMYTCSWYPGGNASEEFDGTTHGAKSDGASFTFSFTGISISVFGTVIAAPSDNATSTVNFMIDDGSADAIVTPLTPTALYHHQYYASSLLDGNEPHQLKVTVSPCDPVNIFWFDYIQYTPFIPQASTSSQFPNSPPVTPAPSPPPSAPDTPSPPSSSPPAFPSPAQPSSPIPLDHNNSASATAVGLWSTTIPLGSSAPPTTVTTTASVGATAVEVIPSPAGQGKTTSNLSTALPAALAPSCVLLLALLAFLIWWRKYRAKKRFRASDQSDKGDIPLGGGANPRGSTTFPYQLGNVDTPGSATRLLSSALHHLPQSSHSEFSGLSTESIYSPPPVTPAHGGMLASQISSSNTAIQAIEDEKSAPRPQRAPARLRSIHHVDGGVRVDGGPTSDSGVGAVHEHPPQYQEY